MRIFFVRHGETEENARHICQGQTPGTLSPRGREEAGLTGIALRHEPIACCYTSDQKRASDTARIILRELAAPGVPLIPDRRLRERYFGSFEGKVFPPYSDEVVPVDEVEKAPQIAVRLTSFLEEIIPRHREDETVLVLSHGYTMRVLMALLYGQDPAGVTDHETPYNCSITEVLADAPDSYRVLRFNDVRHLAPPEKEP